MANKIRFMARAAFAEANRAVIGRLFAGPAAAAPKDRCRPTDNDPAFTSPRPVLISPRC